MIEEWRTVSRAPAYEVSNHGRIRRAIAGHSRTWAGRVMTPVKMKTGYYMVRPTVDGKNAAFTVHSLVAEAFLGTRPAGQCVNHIDGDKLNNHSSNLEYVTQGENVRHARRMGLTKVGEKHGGSRLTEDDVRAIRVARDSGESFGSISRRTGVSIGHVFQICKRTTWRHVA